jgi:hypothetical protein
MLKKSYNEFLYFKWARFKYKNPKADLYVVHLLVVKKPVYVSISKTCILSFLYYHPNSKVLVHCDEVTVLGLNKVLSSLIKTGRVNLLIVNSDQKQSWQKQKIELMLKLNGTDHIFMDADLKWNGTLPSIEGINFFVKEFDLLSNNIYKNFIEQLIDGDLEEIYMWNTSFLTFGGLYEPSFNTTEMDKLEKGVIEVINRLEPDNLRSTFSRISEQLSISLSTKNWMHPINALKEIDGHKDGSFSESSYFGATGLTF